MNRDFMMQNIFYHAEEGPPRAPGLDRLERIGLYWVRHFDHDFAM
jgi:hypothetical protein